MGNSQQQQWVLLKRKIYLGKAEKRDVNLLWGKWEVLSIWKYHHACFENFFLSTELLMLLEKCMSVEQPDLEEKISPDNSRTLNPCTWRELNAENCIWGHYC